jgi:hypothetical protein
MHGNVLTGLATQSNAQGDQLKQLANVAVNDSRSMKIVTFIATLYLPANLLAVSSNPSSHCIYA